MAFCRCRFDRVPDARCSKAYPRCHQAPTLAQDAELRSSTLQHICLMAISLCTRAPELSKQSSCEAVLAGTSA